MNRKYNISDEGILKSFMYSHHQACGWEYCVLIHDAWKFHTTLRNVSIYSSAEVLDDYLIAECPTMDEAISFCNHLSDNLPRISIWERGRIVYDSKDNKENEDG